MSKRTRNRSHPQAVRTPAPGVAVPDRLMSIVSPTSGLAARLSDRTRFVLFRLLPFLAMAGILLFLAATNSSAEDVIRAGPVTIDNRWPKELAFQVTASSDVADISEMTVRLQVGAGNVMQLGKVEFTPGRSVKGEYVMKTRGPAFIPIGTALEYSVEIVDAAGNRLNTPKVTSMYLDPRFTWSSMKSAVEPASAWYYGNGEQAARLSLKAVEAAAKKMEQQAGMTIARPFKLIIYNSREHWKEAQNTRSETQERELILLGTAYGDHDLVLVLADPMVGEPGDTAAHESTHLFVHWSAGGNVPAWLNEGLAVYGQARVDDGYLSQLGRSIKADSLYPLRGLDQLPGRPEDNIAGYGQAYSVVSYLISTHGPQKMHELLVSLKTSGNINDSLKTVYGLDIDGLDAKWRESVGAKARSYDFTAPTPIPMPNLMPLGAPQASSAPSGSPARSGDGAAVPASNPASAFTLLGIGLIGVSLLAAAGMTAMRFIKRS